MQPGDSETVDYQTSEVEWQFDVPDLDLIGRWLDTSVPHGGLVPEPSGRREVIDSYVDSADLQLHSAGLVARLRTADGQAEVTVKSLASDGAPGTGLRRRLELSQPLSYALLYKLIESRGEVVDRIRQHVSPRELRVLFTVRTDRRTWNLVSAGDRVGEVSLDDAVVEAGNHSSAIRRIEVEARTADDEQRLIPFVEVLRIAHRLSAGTSSKFGDGLELARLAGLVLVDEA